ncbi:glycoside hydrolase family 32 protein [Galbibacter sp. EGI 63066]|uniref:glycoside hydrolase family 32 protein n=1 Tax=Galbibacter sp. EGI 63066 TaxID=2993559 RepID=UPI002B255126|nr:glycoside hydrolase family 32 protein [Galbibacter sp. EGI 63066]
MLKGFILFIFISLTVSCNEKTKKETQDENALSINEDEKYRPNFHFTPKEHWMNDPNGMFYYNGYYHLFFQYYPDGNVWGPMHWGHAISTDMVEWRELPIALYPDELGYIFSGSAVVDHNNTTGFGDGTTPPIVAIYTYHDPKGEKEGRDDYQTQGIAYSLDEGATWTKYENNPVINNPGIKDFRDPKVVWDEIHQQWLMVLAADDKALFYGSKNLKDWEKLSEFGQNIGAHGGVWECPDIFPMQVEGTDEVKWVLIQSLNPGGYNSGSGTQYFVGDFDGKEFTLDPDFKNDLEQEHTYWIDFGKDNYAGVTWSNIPDTDGRKLFLGWMSNWEYAQEVPTETWRSAMTIARELTLKKDGGSYRLFSVPAKELYNYRAKSFKVDSLSIQKNTKIVGTEQIDLSSTELSFNISDLKEDIYTFYLHNPKGDTISFGLDNKKNEFFIDRSKSGLIDFSEKFSQKPSVAPRVTESDKLTVQIILDETSIEIFYDKGASVMTEIFFPHAPFETFSVSTEDPNAVIKNLTIDQLKFN